MKRSLVGWALALVFVLCATPLARAQGSPDPAPTTVLLDLGFNGALPAGRWAPVRVSISPMDTAVQSVARMVITTPGGDSITTIVPAATTPGRETIVPTTVWVPPSIASITVELVDQDGRRLANSAYGAVAGARAITLTPPTAMPIILGVGSPSLRMAFGAENYQRKFFGPEGELLRARAAVARVASAIPLSTGGPIWLPAISTAYQGLTALVIDGRIAASLEPEGVRAMREWLISGGRVMIVNADNNALRLILGEHLPRGLSVRPAQASDLPLSLGGPGEVNAHIIDVDALPRTWKPLMAASDLVASGPVGLGMVMVAGFDPDDLADIGLVASTEIAWHATLGEMLMDPLEQGRKSLGRHDWDDQPMETIATLNALDWVSRAPTVGVGAFAAIFAMMLALAVALGPIDRIVLKRLGIAHRWWLAALAWITLASLGAWLLPTRVRSGPTNASSVRVIDAWQPTTSPAHAWHTSVDGIFMNRSATIGLDDIEEGSWLAPLPHPWASTNTGSLVMAPSGSVMKPKPTTARLWTVRNFQQHGTLAPPIAARFINDDGRYTLRLSGPLASAVEIAAVRTSGQWLHLMPGSSPRNDNGSMVFIATRQDLTHTLPRPFDPQASTGQGQTRSLLSSADHLEPSPAVMLHLPSAASRNAAFDALSDTDQWAVVHLKWKNDTPLFARDVGETFTTIWVCRLAVPVESTP